jgi:nicotinamidase-related amidase
MTTSTATRDGARKRAPRRALASYELPAPAIFKPRRVGSFFTPDYKAIMAAAAQWRAEHGIAPRRLDLMTVAMAIIDQQKTFVLKDGELSIAPASIQDTLNLCEFIYRNARVLSDLIFTLDSHTLFQIFHPLFWVDATGNHPDGFTAILPADVGTKWHVNPEMSFIIFGDMRHVEWLVKYARAYTQSLGDNGKPPLVVWPVHGRLGSPGHAIVPSLQTAADMHAIARWSRTRYLLKGQKPLSENYSPFGSEVVEIEIDGTKHVVGESSDEAIDELLAYDILIFAGEAESHCVRAGLYDVERRIRVKCPEKVGNCYILENCTSPVPGFEAQGKACIADMKDAGMHIVNSYTPMHQWPGPAQRLFAGK